MMDKATVARRLSGALGRGVDPDEIKAIEDLPSASIVEVELVGGEVWVLSHGNGAVGEAGEAYYRNGKRLKGGYDEFHGLK